MASDRGQLCGLLFALWLWVLRADGEVRRAFRPNDAAESS